MTCAKERFKPLGCNGGLTHPHNNRAAKHELEEQLLCNFPGVLLYDVLVHQ